jgi:adenine-specific DNA-methyltransferase
MTFKAQAIFGNVWVDTGTGNPSQTRRSTSFRHRRRSSSDACLMATDPGDLVLDPTCGSGTTATVAEQWGRRWITIDTSRVALALGPRPHHGRALSRTTCSPTASDGQQKEAEVTRQAGESPSRRTATSATASSTSASRTSR